MKKRIVSLLLVLATLLTMFTVPVGAAKRSYSQELATLIDGSKDMPDLGEILVVFYKVNQAIYLLTGLECFSDEVFGITADAMVHSLVSGILEDTGVDFGKIIRYFPVVDRATSKVTAKLGINMAVLRDELKEASDDLRKQGKTVEADVALVLSIIAGEVDECEVRCVPLDGNANRYSLQIAITYQDGKEEIVEPEIYYDVQKNALVGKNNGPAIMGFYMDFNQNFTYTGIDVWQHDFGFCLLYDLVCFATPYIMNYNTKRIKFDYDNREWMIQIWKGTYFITNGMEVGVYNRPENSIGTYYNCVEPADMLTMAVSLYHGDDLLIKRDAQRHWWMTGFSVSDTAYRPSTLTLVAAITFKDEDMRDAFIDSVQKQLGIDYKSDGLTVTIIW